MCKKSTLQWLLRTNNNNNNNNLFHRDPSIPVAAQSAIKRSDNSLTVIEMITVLFFYHSYFSVRGI